MQWLKKLWQKKWLRVVLVILLIVASGVAIGVEVIYRTYASVRDGCLAQTLDVFLDKKGHKKNPQVFAQQVAFAIIIHQRRIEQGLEFACPPANVQGRAEVAKRWLFSSTKLWRQSQRHVIINDAINGKFKYDWPKAYDCVNDYNASRPRRGWDVAKSIVTLHWPRRPVGRIGSNMFLYCTYPPKKR